VPATGTTSHPLPYIELTLLFENSWRRIAQEDLRGTRLGHVTSAHDLEFLVPLQIMGRCWVPRRVGRPAGFLDRIGQGGDIGNILADLDLSIRIEAIKDSCIDSNGRFGTRKTS